MASTLSMSIVNSSLSRLCIPHPKYSSKTLFHRTNPLLLSGERNLCSRSLVVLQSNRNSKLPCSNWRVERGLRLICSYKKDEFQPKESETEWLILKQWDVPWGWQKVSLTSLACVLSFILAGLIEMAALPSLGLQVGELSLDEKAEILFLDQVITTAVVLVVLRSLTNTSEPSSDDLFRYDWSKPFDLQRGWLLWAAIGLFGAVAGIAVTGAAVSFFNGATPERDTDALILLLPLIGSSTTSTACLVGITGVLAPILEETVFRGFLLVSLTKWLPTPVSVVISAAVFAAAHLTPAQFLPLFVLGIAMGFSYAQTRNLVTPITIHAIWNSGVIVLLTILQLQGYDIRELLQGS